MRYLFTRMAKNLFSNKYLQIIAIRAFTIMIVAYKYIKYYLINNFHFFVAFICKSNGMYAKKFQKNKILIVDQLITGYYYSY